MTNGPGADFSPHVGLEVVPSSYHSSSTQRATSADLSAFSLPATQQEQHPQHFPVGTNTSQEQNSMHLQRHPANNHYLYSDGGMMSGFQANLPAWGYGGGGGQMILGSLQQQQQYLMQQQGFQMYGQQQQQQQHQAAPRRRPTNAANNAALQIALALIASQPPQDE